MNQQPIDIGEYPVEELQTREGSKVLFVAKSKNQKPDGYYYYSCIAENKDETYYLSCSKSGQYVNSGEHRNDIILKPKPQKVEEIDIGNYPVERLRTRDGHKILFVNKNNDSEETDPTRYYCLVIQGNLKHEHDSIFVCKSGKYLEYDLSSPYDILILPEDKPLNLEEHLSLYPNLQTKDGSYQAVALVKKPNGDYCALLHNTTRKNWFTVLSYTKDGKWEAVKSPSNLDLILKPT